MGPRRQVLLEELFKETDDGIYVCRDDYAKIVGATPRRNG
jgi:hypothetical protein